MTDRFVWSCRACTNAVVAGLEPPERESCPACHATEEEMSVGGLWNREGQIR